MADKLQIDHHELQERLKPEFSIFAAWGFQAADFLLRMCFLNVILSEERAKNPFDGCQQHYLAGKKTPDLEFGLDTSQLASICGLVGILRYRSE
ncbi:MAG: hypothetical protein U0401_35260 [Anaerolineae bacterium]